jgi:hypothetical protein
MATICSLSDGSVQLQPILTASLSDEMELLVGLTLNFGAGPETDFGPLPAIRSEFGTAPDTLFLEWKYYF